MFRVEQRPRDDWRATVEAQGLVYPVTVHDDGTETPYWFEEAAYVLSLSEVEQIEAATETLHQMCVEAGRFLASGAFGQLGLPPWALPVVMQSFVAGEPSLYGRFDLRYDPADGDLKMIEYNADTPTGLVESAVAQWHWLEDTHPDRDQWNSLHDRLVARWRELASAWPAGRPLHLMHHSADDTGEEWMTVAYLRDTAEAAGIPTIGMTIDASPQCAGVGYDLGARQFVDHDGRPIEAAFKLYPWEEMLAEEFGEYASGPRTQWIEPLWKVVLSNKALLAALWHLYPGNPLLLPAYLDGPHGMAEWIAKPLHGREGASMRIHTAAGERLQPGTYGSEGYCWQQWAPLPDLGGGHVVLGSWVVDGKAAGLGIRESDNPITDYYARFVPHYVDAPTPSPEQVNTWLAE